VRGEGERTLMVVGVTHGDERAGRAVVRELRRRVLPAGVRVVTIDVLNPDGARRGTRGNARGVDLNRNFSAGWRRIPKGSSRYSGPRPFSEPESRFLRRAVIRYQPDVTIHYHQALSLVYRPAGTSPAVVRAYARRAGLPVRRSPPYPGTASRWQKSRFPDDEPFVVELGPGRLGAAAARRHARAALATLGPAV
jgi:protein MpaA